MQINITSRTQWNAYYYVWEKERDKGWMKIYKFNIIIVTVIRMNNLYTNK